MPEDLQDIDDPYAVEKAADRAKRQEQLEAELRQHEELRRAFQRLTDTLQLKPSASDQVEQELQKARERLKGEGGKE